LVKMDPDFKLDGWLSVLLGDKPVFDFSRIEDNFQDKMSLLVVELGMRGKSRDSISTPVLQQLPIRMWNVNQVGQWLEKNGLGKYKEVFAHNDIDGMALIGLMNLAVKDIYNVYEILSQLGVYSIGHKLKIIVLLKEL